MDVRQPIPQRSRAQKLISAARSTADRWRQEEQDRASYSVEQSHYPISIIVSGGQTGADRAALDWAIQHGVPHGGWCPGGRLAEDGELHSRYHLKETESIGYRQRTKLNVSDSDGTLIVNTGELDGGTLATRRFAESIQKSMLVITFDDGIAITTLAVRVLEWIATNSIKILNVAGPRESKRPGIYQLTFDLLDASLNVRSESKR